MILTHYALEMLKRPTGSTKVRCVKPPAPISNLRTPWRAAPITSTFISENAGKRAAIHSMNAANNMQRFRSNQGGNLDKVRIIPCLHPRHGEPHGDLTRRNQHHHRQGPNDANDDPQGCAPGAWRRLRRPHCLSRECWGVTVSRADDDEDPAIDSFLNFLAADLKRHPEAVKALGPELAARITALTADVPVDLNDAIDGDVAL